MKKWICLFLLITMWLFAFSGMAEDVVTEEGDGSGEVIFVEDEEIEEGLLQNLEPSEPCAPQELEKAVIGADNRVTVHDPYQWPYCSIALMEVSADCGCQWTCSGFVASKEGVFLTAAHCLVCADHSEWANNIKFYFGYKSSKNYYYRYTGPWSAYVGTTFSRREYSIRNDYAVVKLDKRVADKVGWFGTYWARSDEEIQSYYAYVAGYRDGKLRYDSGFLQVLDDDHVKFTMDEVSGNSGGPIYTSDGYALGIIIAEHSNNGRFTYNIGYRLTYDVYYRWLEYKEK